MSIGVLVAALILSSPVSANSDEASHDARIRELEAMARQLKIDTAETQNSEFGGAIALAGKFLVGEQDDFRWQINFGNTELITVGRMGFALTNYEISTID